MKPYIQQVGTKCVWCHKSEGELVQVEVQIPDSLGRQVLPVELFMHPEHEKKTRAYLDRVRQYSGRATLAGAAAALWMLVGLAVVLISGRSIETGDLSTAVIFGLPFVLIGIGIIVFPVAWSGTYRLLGVARSIVVARVIGLLALAVGIWLLLGGFSII
jgi:hypothetical protein